MSGQPRLRVQLLLAAVPALIGAVAPVFLEKAFKALEARRAAQNGPKCDNPPASKN